METNQKSFLHCLVSVVYDESTLVVHVFCVVFTFVFHEKKYDTRIRWVEVVNRRGPRW